MKYESMRLVVARALACGLVAFLAACSGGGGSGSTSGGEAPPAPVAVASVYAGALQPATGSRDGIGAAALFNRPGGVTQDAAGTVYVADTGNQTIRKITPQGVVTTFAGAAGQAGSADGSGVSARFRSPQGLAIDAAGFVYVADTGNHTVRKISPAGGVTTVAGLAGQAGAIDGNNAAARLNAPTRLALDGVGAVYVLSDTAVRKVASDGNVSTFPVVPRTGNAALGVLFSGIAVDRADNVFVAEYPSDGGGSVVSVNKGSIGKFDPNGLALTAGPAAQRLRNFVLPRDIALDADGNLAVLQVGYFSVSAGHVSFYRNVQRIAADGTVTTLAGREDEGRNGMTVDGSVATARFADPTAISVAPSGRIVVVEAITGAVRVIAQGSVSTLAGGNGSGYVDGAGRAARFGTPQGLAAAGDGTLYVIERGNQSLRRITPAGQVSTVRAPDTLTLPFNVAVGADGAVFLTDTSLSNLNFCTGSHYRVDQLATGPGGTGRSVSYNGSEDAHALAVDAQSNVVVNETAQGGCGLRYDKPTQIAAYALDGSKRVLATGIEATALAADASGRLYFATAQGTVGSLDSSGQIQLRAGVAGQLGEQDGPAADARFRAITALAVDTAGNLYVADGTRIRKITPAGSVITITDLSSAEGADAAARSIGGLAWVSGALYATFQQAVIRIAPVS